MQPKLTNEEIARLLKRVSAAYTIKGFNRFRIIAYDNAAETIEKSNIEVKDIWQDGKLSRLPGIGSSIASHLDELFKTGKVKSFEEAFKGLPEGMFPLLEIPTFGPKKAYRLAEEFKLFKAESAVEDLLNIANQGKIANLDGFGEKSQAEIIDALSRYKKLGSKQKRMALPYAHQTAIQVIDYLKKNKDVKRVYTLGSLRRRVSTIGDIDLAASTENSDKVLDWFLKYPKFAKLVERGPSGATIYLDTGQHIDLRVQSPKTFGAMLQYFTGSKAHNIRLREYGLKKGFSLNEYGMKPIKSVSNHKIDKKFFNQQKNIYEFENEKDFYAVLGLPLIPPELREDRGEMELAIKGVLPNLVEKGDIKGEVHVHSSYDLNPSHDLGESSVKEMLQKAQDLGYDYLGFSEHNPQTSNLSANQITAIMRKRKSDYEQIMLSNKSIRVKMFVMLECDISPDGTLALPDQAHEYVDAMVVSIHSRFDMGKEEMTKRILKGLSYKKAKILAHPTGRLIGKREGYEANWDQIFNYCKQNNKALEINSYPDRLDLADIMVKQAIENGNKLVIDTDSHHKDQMEMIDYGISVARRGWATKHDIINTLSYKDFANWLQK